jgi:hypothetical protein
MMTFSFSQRARVMDKATGLNALLNSTASDLDT